MIDIELLRGDPEKVKKGVADKQFDVSLIDKALQLDKKRRERLQEVENLRANRNKFAKEKNIEEGKRVKAELQKLEPHLEEAEKSFNEVFNQIPNSPLPQVPVGKSDKENVEVRRWGEPRKFDFEPKDHLQLGKNLGILDFETGAKVAGSQFYFWYGDGALLELSLIQFAFEILSKEGFVPVITPDLAKARYYMGTGYLPRGKEAQTYEIKNEDLGLTATAEVTLAGKHADEVIAEDKLPLKYIGYSHCFRQEAGAYGKYSKGLYRVHQFTKAEMFIYCKPEESEAMHEHILAMEEKIYQGYVLVNMVVTDDSWYVVRNTPRVTGFVGTGTTPTPLSPEEVKILQQRMGVDEPKYKIEVSMGDIVKITDGPFRDYDGKISEVDEERGKIKVLVSIFGRETPVELDFLQVKKV